jgi:hypothetical protein
MPKKAAYTKKQIIEALENTAGFKTYAAKNLGCSYQTILNYFERYPDLEDTLTHIRERKLDLAEHQLVKAIDRGEPWAIKYYLKYQGKMRGYIERQEFTGGDGELMPTGLLILPSIDEAQEKYKLDADKL